jgi:hypothetical protein
MLPAEARIGCLIRHSQHSAGEKAGKGSRQKSRLISIRLSLQGSSAPLAQVLRHPQQQALQQPLVLVCRPQQAVGR